MVGGETLRVGPKREGDPEDVLCRAGPWWEGRP